MALVDSLLTALVRADGDALVMHVGERPYVVASAGTLDLSSQSLNLDAMTGMLQQLLPTAAQDSLKEFGAVEHRLPLHDHDTFTVVAARGGDDVWIEIRRLRHAVEAVVAASAPTAAPPPVEPQPAVEIAAPASPVVEEPRPAMAQAPDPQPVREVAPAIAVEPDRVEMPPELEAAATVEAPSPVATVVSNEPVAPSQPVVSSEPVVQSDPVPAIAAPPDIVAAPVTMPEVETPVAETAPPREQPPLEELPLVAAEPPSVVDQPIAVLVDELPPLDWPHMNEPLPLNADSPASEVRASIEDDGLAELLGEPLYAQASATARPAAAEIAMATPLAAHAEDEAAAPHAPHATETTATPVAPIAAESAAGSEVPDRARVLQMTRTVRIEVPPRGTAARGSGVERLLRLAASRAASALFVISDTRPSIRVEGEIRTLDGEPPMTRAEIESALMEIVPEASQEALVRGEPTEWITDFGDLGRVRCISFTDHRGPGVVFRMMATHVATADQLGLSREVQAMATEPQGLVLVAGRPGSGKSTLVAALVDLVNRQRAEYIITLERQVRLVHANHAAIVSQREIRGGAEEALTAARAALREDPDVLVVDDVASGPMVPLLLQAAAEGLVFVSIAAPSTIDAVERFVDLAPADMRAGVQAAMADTFRGAVAQVLLKKAGGGRVAAREVLLATAAVTRVISDGTSGLLQVALEAGRPDGMVPLFDAVAGLVQSGVVDVREAFRKSPDRGRLVAGLKREGVDTSLVERLA